MARIHYRDGRMEEVAIPKRAAIWEQVWFHAPLSYDSDPTDTVSATRQIFKAADYGYEVEISRHVIHHPDMMDSVLSTAKNEGVPEYADFGEPEMELFRGSYILIARWLEYFECRPALPRGKRARFKAWRRMHMKEWNHAKAWIKKVKRTAREMDLSFHEAKEWITRDPVNKVGSWHSRWEGE